MSVYAGPVQDLIDELGRLPGVGPKSAQRIAFHLLKLPKEDAVRLSRAIVVAKEKVAWCTRCFNLADAELCAICGDDRRDSTMLCVVEEPKDLVAVEKTGEYRGRYHVLQGAINPMEGIGPDQIRVKELLTRIVPEEVEEIILCTNPNIEGEATAMYLARTLGPLGLKVTRIASGLPVGGDLEYADELTLGRALEGRREVGG
ncbi:MAG: recombination mediator RecR [Aquihabitans sp.]